MKGIMKKCSAVLMLFGMICSLFFAVETVYASSPSEAKDSVVCIGVGDSKGNLIGWGTGFAIGQTGEPIQYIVTNAHVAEPTDEDGNYIPCSLTVYFSAAANQSMMAEVYWCDQSSDLAILKLPEETDQREALVLCPMEDVDMDDDFAALGYPATSMASDFVKFDTTDISITRGGISKQVRVSGRDCYLLDIQISQGNSGGPLVNSKGEVVGVNTFMLNEEARYAVAIDELIRDVSQDEVPYELAGQQFPIFYIAIGAAVIILIIIFVVIFATRRKSEVVAGSGPVSVPAPAPDPGVWQQTVPEPVPDYTAHQSSRYHLSGGIASPLAGKTYGISQETIIGRDGARCDIVFPVDTKGVSAKHCKVTPSAEGILLSDLGSTYGTFLANGTKVEPGQNRLLHPGDAFYLGGEDNRFEVR